MSYRGLRHNRALCLNDDFRRSWPTYRSVTCFLLAAALLTSLPASADGAQQEQKHAAKAEQAQEEKEPSKLFRALGWGVYGASAADVISTEIALSRGAYEGNPFMRNRPLRISFHIGVPILVNYATEKARKKGHEKVALWMRIALVAGYSAVAVHNLRQGQR